WNASPKPFAACGKRTSTRRALRSADPTRGFARRARAGAPRRAQACREPRVESPRREDARLLAERLHDLHGALGGGEEGRTYARARGLIRATLRTYGCLRYARALVRALRGLD